MKNEWHFGTLRDGREVTAYELTSQSGLRAKILNYGAILHALYLPNGRNLILNHETLSDYETDRSHLGQIIGRNANRIKDAKFEINGRDFTLNTNDGQDNLHSGPNGFGRQLWRVNENGDNLVMRHNSPDGHEGFPGEVQVELCFSLKGNCLRLEMTANTSKPCPINLTWHPYWNLLGKDKIDGHDLYVASDSLKNMNDISSTSVKNTRFDFLKSRPLGSVQIDENYALTNEVQLSARNMSLRVKSSLPDMQIYTGDHLPVPRTGIAIEPQFRPNDINFDQQSLLQPESTYRHWIEYIIEMS